MADFNSKRIEREQIRMFENAKESWRDALELDEATYGDSDPEYQKKQKLKKAKEGLAPGKGFQGKYDQHGREYDTKTGKLVKEDLEGIEKAKKGAFETTTGDIKKGAKDKAKEAGVDDDVVSAAEKKGNKHPFVIINPPKRGSIRESVNISLQPNTEFREAKELSIGDQMRISREASRKRGPIPKGGYDHRALRAKQLAKAPTEKSPKSDAEKMTDATGPRPGSNYRGD